VRAVIYSRFSTDRQSETSIADQVRICTEHAERQGWTIVERYEDQGISGAALGNRPGVLRLREAALARRFDLVLVTDLSRLSRSQDLAPLLTRLRHGGLRVIGVQDGFDSDARHARMQAGLSGIMSEEFRAMVADRTYAALESRAKESKPTGGRAYGYRDHQVDEGEAFIVREIFAKFGAGASCRAIAEELNSRRIPSPGSSWNRTKRRAQGWMGSSVRVILRNERYRGVVHWNTSEWRKDPDSGKRQRVMRPRAEWISHVDESLRIVSEELWERAQRRTSPPAGDLRVNTGGVTPGRRRYLLSGLLRCESCGAHYTIADAKSYACHSFNDGRACSNGVRVRRDRAEAVLIDPIREALFAPEHVQFMAREMEGYYRERVRSMQGRAAQAPKELEELDARIARLRERLRQGDPDLAADELQAAIERAEAKRRDLERQQPAAKASAKLFSLLPRAAEQCRRQIERAMAGDERAILRTRVFLRDWFGGKIRLEALPDGGLMAHWNENAGTALLRAVGQQDRVVAGAGFEPATFGL
jgi:site-specific DNA recombinase